MLPAPLRISICVCLIASCSKPTGSSQTKSSYPQAVQQLCDIPNDVQKATGHLSPPERQQALAQWKPPTLANEKAAQLASELLGLAPPQAVARLQAAAKEAGIAECALATQWQSTLPLEPITVVDSWLDPVVPMTTLRITGKAVSIHDSHTQGSGQIIMAIEDGEFVGEDPDHIISVQLTKALDALPKGKGVKVTTYSLGGDVERPIERPIAILAEPEVTYKQLFRVVASARGRQLSMILRGAKGELGNFALYMPEPSALYMPEASAPDETRINLIVSVTKSRLLLWSVTGMEGSLAEPKLELAKQGAGYDYVALTSALEEIVKRRWPTGTARSPEHHDIILQAGGTVPFQVIADLAVALRGGYREAPLFPLVVLAKPSFD